MVESGWTAVSNDIELSTVDGREVLSYGMHTLDVSAADLEGKTKACRHNFIACKFDIPDITFILGYPWLYNVDPAISFRSRIWRYSYNKTQINLLTAKKFSKEVRQ